MITPGGAAIIAPRERQKAQTAATDPLGHGEDAGFSHCRLRDGGSLAARCVQAFYGPAFLLHSLFLNI